MTDLDKDSVQIEHTEVGPPKHFADFDINRPEDEPWTATGHGSALTVMQDSEVDIRHWRTLKPYVQPDRPLWDKRQTSWLVTRHGDTYIHIKPNGTGGLNIVVAGHNLALD
jgi:hypothetical protein